MTVEKPAGELVRRMADRAIFSDDHLALLAGNCRYALLEGEDDSAEDAASFVMLSIGRDSL